MKLRDYRKKKYWDDRYKMYPDLRGSGRCNISAYENKIIYNYYQSVVDEMIGENAENIIDIGCGVGYYAKKFMKFGAKNYLGIDISEECVEKLKHSGFPFNFEFRELDITKNPIMYRFIPDIILCLDVTQHIVNDKDFMFAMDDIRRCMTWTGTKLLITSHLKNKKFGFYEVGRNYSKYLDVFGNGYNISTPQRYRDKWIFSISKILV